MLTNFSEWGRNADPLGEFPDFNLSLAVMTPREALSVTEAYLEWGGKAPPPRFLELMLEIFVLRDGKEV